MAKDNPKPAVDIKKRRKQLEGVATFGLILICVALVSPFTNPTSVEALRVFRWIYGAGAVIFLIARIADATDPTESLRLRRLRRLEFWAGISFGIACGFWFYNQHHYGPYAGVLAILQTTILFTLVGAIIQILASWLIWSQAKKEIQKRS